MFKTLLKQIGDYKKDAILTPVFVILEVVMEVIIPLMMAAIIDYGLSKQSLKMVCLIGAAMIVMAGLALFFGVESGTTASSASFGFAMNLRQAMYEKIQNFSFSNIDKFSTAGLVTRMTTDVMNTRRHRECEVVLCHTDTKVVKVFCHEDACIQDFKCLNGKLRDSANNANRYASILMPVLGNLGYVEAA